MDHLELTKLDDESIANRLIASGDGDLSEVKAALVVALNRIAELDGDIDNLDTELQNLNRRLDKLNSI